MKYLNLSSPDLNAHLLNVKYISIVSFFRLLVAKEVRNLCCHEKALKTITDKIGTVLVRSLHRQRKENMLSALMERELLLHYIPLFVCFTIFNYFVRFMI